MKPHLQWLPAYPTLLLISFALVVLPLLGGLFTMTRLLDALAREGAQSVNLTAEITLTSRRLAEAGVALNRAAGQYFVLEDPAMKSRLDQTHHRFIDLLAKLHRMPWEPAQADLLSALANQEMRLYRRLQAAPVTGAAQFERFQDDFDRLNRSLAGVGEQASRLAQQRVARMSETVEGRRQAMVWQMGVVAGLTLLLATLLCWLISRPVRQLAAAIERLGRHELETPPVIRGPRDFAHLGEQLDWLRQRLQELEAEKLRFFREVSHELKTPLTRLLEAVSLLRDEVTGPLTAPQREVATIMGSSAEDLKQRIEDLLRYNAALRPSERPPSTIDLEQLVKEVGERFDLSLRAKALQLNCSLPGGRFLADRERLATALENLISNAVTHSPRGGRIDVTATTLPRALQIRVCDQGPGVPASGASQLFEPFFKGTQTAEGTLKSSGLGLAIAKAHIESQRGALVLVPGGATGACFQITLPQPQQSMTDGQ